MKWFRRIGIGCFVLNIVALAVLSLVAKYTDYSVQVTVGRYLWPIALGGGVFLGIVFYSMSLMSWPSAVLGNSSIRMYGYMSAGFFLSFYLFAVLGVVYGTDLLFSGSVVATESGYTILLIVLLMLGLLFFLIYSIKNYRVGSLFLAVKSIGWAFIIVLCIQVFWIIMAASNSSSAVGLLFAWPAIVVIAGSLGGIGIALLLLGTRMQHEKDRSQSSIHKT